MDVYDLTEDEFLDGPDRQESDLYYPEDPMCQRAEMALRIGRHLDEVEDPAANMILLKVMDALLFTINPKRGELVEFPGGKEGAHGKAD